MAKVFLQYTEDDLENIIYMNECCVSTNNNQPIRVWRTPGEAYLPECVVPDFHSGRFSVKIWGAVTFNAKSDLVIFPEGKVTAKLYNELVLEGELPQFVEHLNQLHVLDNPNTNLHLRIIEDNASIHSAKLCQSTRSRLN
jgi:hypothetical protein